jgi:phosphoenolpyruvate carboxylase
MIATNLRHDIDELNQLLEHVLAEQAGSALVDALRQIRQLAHERRLGLPGAGDLLAERIARLTEDEMAAVVRALGLYFDLANLAEDLQRVRVLRERERSAKDAEPAESIADAVARWKQSGLPAEEVQTLLDRLSIDLVFTAHPTEAKRRTTRRVLRELRTILQATRRTDVLPREQREFRERLLSALTLLWQVDPIRPQRPTVMHEVERGLFFFESLWQILPVLRRQLRQGLRRHYPEFEFRVPTWLRFGSWIGGDRDGNPFVTSEVTAWALQRLRQAAVERHLDVCRRLSQLLVMSERQFPVDAALHEALHAAVTRWPEVQSAAAQVSEVEVYRRWLKVIETRLAATLAAAGDSPADSPAYATGGELLADVQLLADSIVHHRGRRIVVGYLETWLDQIATFGLQAAALDVRQDSRVHVDVFCEIAQRLGWCEDFRAASEARRQALLLSGPAVGGELLQAGLSDIARDTLMLFQLLVRTVRSQGAERLGGHVISMTHHPSDVLAVWWLWHWAWRATPGGEDQPPAYLPIIPLFETIDDLQRGPRVMTDLLQIPQYRDYLRQSRWAAKSSPAGLPETALAADPTQIVMVGYSDSTKDGGYLAASWGLFRAQDRLAEVTRALGVRLVVFHGRGGALGRGGGPAARAILSLPPRSVGGALRMTEQGEVLAERYDDPQIAQRHLEQVTWATMLVSGLPSEPLPPDWPQLLDRLAERSYRRYRQLVEHPAFLSYFEQATPITEIERLPIGSRPARRRERKSLADLRAIPWTFAWTQCRHILPAWYGLGTALVEEIHGESANGDWHALQTLYNRWPLFQAVIDNAALALAKADLGIARRYAELALTRDPQAEEVWRLIEEEYQRSQAAVLMVTGEPALLSGLPWLQRSIQERNPSVDPLNLIQIELLRRMRTAMEQGADDLVERLSELTRLTIQGVAAGLRTTG